MYWTELKRLAFGVARLVLDGLGRARRAYAER
jgi:hypothetical protein